jgi:ectoine hydroxylase-related dioxygenase (phytanoyl-CoA dioxygenase family)
MLRAYHAAVSDSSAHHLDEIAEHGFTVVPGVLDAGEVGELADAVARLEAELDARPATNSFEGTHTVRVYNLLARGRRFEAVPVHPVVLPLVEGVLDDGCLVSSLSSIHIGPGEVAQPIHADDQVMPLPKPHVATVCNTMWALTDFTEANGATRVIPGSHLADHSPTYGGSFASVPAEMEAGSVLVWHGSLWHGGGANTTETRRLGLAVNYCAGWVRPQENQQLGIPLEVARGFEPRLRDLCGYGVYQGLIGHIDRRPASEVILGPVPESSAPDAPPRTGMVWDHG